MVMVAPSSPPLVHNIMLLVRIYPVKQTTWAGEHLPHSNTSLFPGIAVTTSSCLQCRMNFISMPPAFPIASFL